MSWPDIWTLGGLIALGIHLTGFLHALDALFHVRSSRASIAWILSLVSFPYLALPLYWLFGRNRLEGYIEAWRDDEQTGNETRQRLLEFLQSYRVEPCGGRAKLLRSAEKLAAQPMTGGNAAELFIDGEDTFTALFQAIASAEQELLVAYYVLKNDRVGTRFQEALMERARAGVIVRLLFDSVGSYSLPNESIKCLRKAGVEVASFGARRRWHRFQINFRNHRKLVVIDGRMGFTGGVNVGDEYLGRSEEFGHWRDTHLRLMGPSVAGLKLAFYDDWNWASGHFPELGPLPEPHSADVPCLIFPSGPADRLASWQLFVMEAAASARERLWIASPYFVPDSAVLAALQAAAMRGVDVRVMLPDKKDHLLVWLAGHSFYEETIPHGVRLFRYENGFLHQKALLVDSDVGYVGSANLDNRSLFLNFELGAIGCRESEICQLVEMLEEDFTQCRELSMEEFDGRSFAFKLACRGARLFAPVL